jgi:transmembrane secretion effector
MTPSLHWPVPQVIFSITPDDMQVLIQIEYIIDAARSDEFGCAIRELKNLYLRDGATNWVYSMMLQTPITMSKRLERNRG